MAGAPGFEKHPDYKVEIEPTTHHVVAKIDATVIADSRAVVLLKETHHQPVLYLPWDDLEHNLLIPSDTDTYCPFKGHARYWSVASGAGEIVEDALWRYENPYTECLSIRDYVAFYTNKVTLEVDGAALDTASPDRQA